MVSTSHQNFKHQNIRPFQSKEHHIYFRGNFQEEITNQSCQTTTNRSGIPKEIKEFLGKYHPRIPTLQHTLERPSQFCIMKEWLKTPLRRFSSSPVMQLFYLTSSLTRHIKLPSYRSFIEQEVKASLQWNRRKLADLRVSDIKMPPASPDPL